jgi:hypothetical protein
MGKSEGGEQSKNELSSAEKKEALSAICTQGGAPIYIELSWKCLGLRHFTESPNAIDHGCTG